MGITVSEPADAVGQISNGACVAVSGGGYRVVPNALIDALATSYLEHGSPRDLTIVAVAMIERARAGKGGLASGLNRLAIEGMMARVITSSFSRSAANELNRAIADNTVAAYNVPMGTLIQWLRATAAGRRGFATPVGIGTFVDPRIEGGRVNPRADTEICRIIDIEGEEQIYYPRLPVDVALVKASAADERGNLYFDREAFDHGTIELAMAAHNCGGRVIAEVNRFVPVGAIHPRMGRIPGAIVDTVVVNADVWEDEQAAVLTGAGRPPLAPPADRNLPRDLIARLVVSRLPDGAMVNLGAGLPMYDVPEMARAMGRDDIYFTVEQGPMGGWPQVGGVARHPELILDQNEVFQFYEGGGPDVAVLSFGEVDRVGCVNVSRLGDMLPGCGGFINITHGIDDLIFCGTLTTGGLAETVGAQGIVIEQEGRIQRFVDRVGQITFSGPDALAAGKRVTMVTDRATFALTAEGLVLTDIAPGIDLQADVLDRIAFPVSVAPQCATYPATLLAGAASPDTATGAEPVRAVRT